MHGGKWALRLITNLLHEHLLLLCPDILIDYFYYFTT